MRWLIQATDLAEEKFTQHSYEPAAALAIIYQESLGHSLEMPLDNIKNCLCRQLDCPWEEFAFDVMHFRLDHKVAIMRNASSVAKAFREMRMGFDEQLTYYRDIREIIVGSYSYTRKKKFKKPDIKNYASYVEAYKGRNPRLLNVMSVQNLLNEQAEKITAIKNPTDFLNAIYDCANWMDDTFDHGYVKALFVDRIRSDEQALLINLTPDFLTYYPERLFSRTTVAVRLEQMAELLQLQYGIHGKILDSYLQHS